MRVLIPVRKSIRYELVSVPGSFPASIYMALGQDELVPGLSHMGPTYWDKVTSRNGKFLVNCLYRAEI